MSNIYLIVTVEEKKWRSEKFDFVGFKNVSPTHKNISFETSCCYLKIRVLGANLCVALLLF